MTAQFSPLGMRRQHMGTRYISLEMPVETLNALFTVDVGGAGVSSREMGDDR